MNWKSILNERLKELGKLSIGEDDLLILAGSIFSIVGMHGKQLPSADVIVSSVEGVEVVRFKMYSGLIPEHFLENDECVRATSKDKAAINLAKKFRHKLSTLNDQELVEYLGLVAFEK